MQDLAVLALLTLLRLLGHKKPLLCQDLKAVIRFQCQNPTP